MSFSIKSIIMNNKEILFNLAVLLSSFGFVLLLLRAYEAFENNRKEPLLLILAILSTTSIIIKLPYKWDKFFMKIEAGFKIPIFIATIILYSIPFFNNYSKDSYE
jgi:hypothetical protein